MRYLDESDLRFFKCELQEKLLGLERDLRLELSKEGNQAVRDHKFYLKGRFDRLKATLDAIDTGELVLTLEPRVPDADLV